MEDSIDYSFTGYGGLPRSRCDPTFFLCVVASFNIQISSAGVVMIDTSLCHFDCRGYDNIREYDF